MENKFTQLCSLDIYDHEVDIRGWDFDNNNVIMNVLIDNISLRLNAQLVCRKTCLFPMFLFFQEVGCKNLHAT